MLGSFVRSSSFASIRSKAWKARLVLGPHGEALDFGIGAGALGHRPALEDAVRLDAEIPVQPGCVMLLDDEAVAAFARGAFARRFRGLLEVAFAVVVREGNRKGTWCQQSPRSGSEHRRWRALSETDA